MDYPRLMWGPTGDEVTVQTLSEQETREAAGYRAFPPDSLQAADVPPVEEPEPEPAPDPDPKHDATSGHHVRRAKG